MKFSIITPSCNSEKYIRETIESVIRQRGDFSIEYFVLDNLSSDRTCDIVREYQELLVTGKMVVHCRDVQLSLITEQDSGMYDAISKGFKNACGDIYAWINSDDIYLPGAFDIVQRTLSKYPEISWLKGITSYMNENSTIYEAGCCFLYRQDWIKAGLYGTALYFIQQDSVFWRAKLWQEGDEINKNLSLAGDYFLWKSFAKSAPLYSLNAYVSCFRKAPGQKSTDINAYWREIEEFSILTNGLSGRARRYLLERMGALPRFLRSFCYRMVFGRHEHYLVTLENGVHPCLRKGDYFALKAQI